MLRRYTISVVMLWCLHLNIIANCVIPHCAEFPLAMCTSPIPIPNPNLGLAKIGHNVLKDCSSEKIWVPCGKCAECISTRQRGYIQRIQMEQTQNYMFMCMLSYNPASLPSYTAPDGYRFNYADLRDFQNMVKRLRKDNAFGRPFRYLGVTEYGSERHRPHFHVLWLVPKYKEDTIYTPIQLQALMYKQVLLYWARNYGSTRHPDYRPLLTFKWRRGPKGFEYNYDLHYVVPLNGDTGFNASMYVMKYMQKETDFVERLRQHVWHYRNTSLLVDTLLWSPAHISDVIDHPSRCKKMSMEKYIWHLVRPKVFKSLGFGLSPDDLDRDHKFTPNKEIIYYLSKCVDRSKRSLPFASFFNPVTGTSFPLAKFYKQRPEVYSLDDAYDFFYNSDSPFSDGTFLRDEKSRSEIMTPYEQSKIRIKHLKRKPDALDLFDDEEDSSEGSSHSA